MTLDWSPIIVGLINLAGIWLAHRATNANVKAVHEQVKEVQAVQQVQQQAIDSTKGGPVS